MKISLQWINEFVDVKDYFENPQALADKLTKAGLEVEEINDRAAHFKNVVVGHIKVKDRHPNADKLSLCQVDVGGGKVSQIVCGAQNHREGDKVVVALPGAVLPGNFTIKISKIRDVESQGMLCSLTELGMAEKSEGIYILDATAMAGQSFADYAGLNDISFELKVTPNRADCLSHYGFAREIGCLLNRPVRPVEVMTRFSSNSSQKKIRLQVDDAELCTRYTGRYIAGVKIGPSPEWIRRRLESVGINSINNVVDVTNYVMLEMGQPLHAFDADRLQSGQLIVRQAKPGEEFKTLKEQDLRLNGEELLIADGEKVLALAGVIGGLNSGVSESTKNIFLESASFKAMSVRKASRLHGVETDSAYRFSRGVDASAAMSCSDRAALLIHQVAGGEVYGEAHDFYPRPVRKEAIRLSLKTVEERLGYSVDEKLFLDYMRGLQIEVKRIENSNLKLGSEFLLTPPLFRFDLEHEMDLVEEYARLHGYEHIQESIPAFRSEPLSHDLNYLNQQGIAQFMRGQGFHQAFNYAFTSQTYENKFVGLSTNAAFESVGLGLKSEAISIRNPLSEELNVMRRLLTPGLWKNAAENIRAGNSQGKLFELGPVFFKSSDDKYPGGQAVYSEPSRLALIAWGQTPGLYSGSGGSSPLVYQLRNAVEAWLMSLQITAITFQQQTDQELALPFVHLGQAATVIVEGKKVGYVATAHPGWLENEKIRVPLALAELDLSFLLRGSRRASRFKSLSKFQPIERDFAFVMGSQAVVGDLIKEVKKSCGAVLKDLIVFDIYEGEKLPAGQKSVALRAVFQSHESALGDSDLQNFSQKIIDAAQKSVQASLR